MKILLILAVVLLTLTGCEFDEWKKQILGKTQEITTEATKKAEEVKKQFNDTKTAVTNKVDNVKKAVKEVNEAVDAVKKATE